MSEEQKSDNGGSGRDEDDTESTESFEGSDDPTTISDDQLPEDLRPTADNPLAKPEGEDDEEGGMNLQEQAGDGAPPS
jgi:hypothetical protein